MTHPPPEGAVEFTLLPPRLLILAMIRRFFIKSILPIREPLVTGAEGWLGLRDSRLAERSELGQFILCTDLLRSYFSRGLAGVKPDSGCVFCTIRLYLPYQPKLAPLG